MAPIRVRFCLGFLSGVGFHREHVFRGFSCGTLEQPHFTLADTL
jgi:hypothetical protein